MADQDLNIRIVTTADTSGIRETEAGLARLAGGGPVKGGFAQPFLAPVPSELLIAEPIKEAAVASEDLAAGALMAGANLTRARQEAIVLARELATGGNVTRTLGSLLGSLGLPITIAAVAGISLNRVIAQAGDAAVKLQQDIGKEYDELIKKTREWANAAKLATTDADVLKIAQSAIPEIEKVQAKLKEVTEEEVGFFKKLFDAFVKGPTFGAQPFLDALKSAQAEQAKVVENTLKQARAAVDAAEANKEAFDERKVEPFIQAIEESTNEIDNLQNAQKALNPLAGDYVQRWVEIGEQIAASRRQLSDLIKDEQKRQAFQKSVDDENKSRAQDLFKGPLTFQREQEQAIREHLAEQAAARAELNSIARAGGAQTEQEAAREKELQRLTGEEANRRFFQDLERKKLLREQALAESQISPGESTTKALGTEGAREYEERAARLRQLTEAERRPPTEPGPNDFKEVITWLQKLYQIWQ